MTKEGANKSMAKIGRDVASLRATVVSRMALITAIPANSKVGIAISAARRGLGELKNKQDELDRYKRQRQKAAKRD